METLALKHRPRTFTDLVGQTDVNVLLRAMVAAQKVPTAMLFAGSHGTGKTTTARILAAALNCETRPGPCAACVSCKAVADGTSLDLVEIDAASNGLVDDIRALRQQVLYGVGGQYRVVVIDEAHGVSAAGFNAMLKMIEEPPPGTIFILATTEPGRIPETVTSRVTPFHFRRITPADIAARLRHIATVEGHSVDEALLGAIAERADGSMRDAIMVLDQMTRAGITTLDGYTALTGAADHGAVLLRHIIAGDTAATYTAVADILTRTGDPRALTDALVATVRDLLVLHGGGEPGCAGLALAERRELAGRTTVPALFAAMTVLWELDTRARCGDPRTGLDLAVAMLLTRLSTAATPPAPTPARRLSLGDLANLR